MFNFDIYFISIFSIYNEASLKASLDFNPWYLNPGTKEMSNILLMLERLDGFEELMFLPVD